MAPEADVKDPSITPGIQSQGRQATIKHLVCNDSETTRREYDVQVDERVLREVYLRPFEIAIKESDPSSIMAAYNVLVSLYCSSTQAESRELTVLRSLNRMARVRVPTSMCLRTLCETSGSTMA